MHNAIVINVVMLMIAIVWGLGFVPQREGMQYIGPAGFNAWRFMFGAVTIFLFLWIKKSCNWRDKSTCKLGAWLGLLLFMAATLQQISIQYTTLANIAFITGFYVIIVPIIGFFFGYRYVAVVWGGGFVAILGLYLLTGSNKQFHILGDPIALLGAVFWALHIMVIARNVKQVDPVCVAFYQCFWCAVYSVVVSLIFEQTILPETLPGYLWPLLNGVIVVGLAYSVQVIILKYADPFAASLVFSLEAVIGAIAGYFYYHEIMSNMALVGAGLMLLGCILCQLPHNQRDPGYRN